VQGHVTVFGQRVQIHTTFSYKYCWMLSQSAERSCPAHHGKPPSSPSWEAFCFPLLSIHLGVTLCPGTCPSFPQRMLDRLRGVSFLPAVPPLPQPHRYFSDVQVSGMVTNYPFHTPLVQRAEAES